TAATTARGAPPKKPEKKRQSMRVCRSLAVATPNWKQAKPSMPMIRGRRRPRNSERGAHRMGPVAKPATKRVTPSVTTSLETPKCWPI
ncbi:hypothetical protein KEM55_001175, partial [Ascosphaera atra]